MTETETQDPRSVRIGELLISVGAMTTGDLTEAIQISRRMGVPIGRVLVMSGCVTEYGLQQALELQSLIKDGLVERDTGETALATVLKEKIDIRTALKRLNWVPKENQAGNKLGDLLVDSTIVSRSQLEQALEASFQSGMPLGGTLVLQGVISAQLLPSLLHVQEQVRDGRMDRHQAIEELKRAVMFWAKADQSKQEELQGSAGSAAGAAAAPKVTGDNGTKDVKPASGAKAIFEGRPPEAAAQPAATPAKATTPGTTGPISLIELMKVSGYCTQASLEKALHEALTDPRLVSKVLLAMGFVDAQTLNNYVHLQALIARGKLRTDQALYVLNSMKHRQLTFEDALAEMGVAPAV